MNALSDLTGPVLAGLGVLVIAQLALQITAVVSLVRTPSERITIGGRKWVWALIIILGEIVGAILYFVLGKTPAPAADVAAAVPAAERAATAADTLYGAAKSEPQDPAAGADGTGMGELP